ncbi:hypothetical protein ACFL6S_36965 [Candidatus Poribacteria bacterium]
MDRESVIQDIAAVLTTLEECSDEELEDVKKFLRWLPDDALQDVKDKHVLALAVTPRASG